MSHRRRTLGLILLATTFVIFLPLHRADSTPQNRDQKRPLRCTPAALAALKAIPKLEYECAERQDDNLKSPERQAAMKDYLQALESVFAEASWWATPVEDLNVCAVIHEARPLSAAERHDFLNHDDQIALFGDQSTRLVAIVDPCISYSYSTLNAFILQRAGERVYATQVLNAYYTRIDDAVDMTLAEHNGERLVMVETHTSDGFMPPTLYTTYAFYRIDRRSHRAVPQKLFQETGKLTHEFRCNNYLFGGDNADEQLADRWRAPEIIRNGRLSPRFTIYTPIKHRLARDTYVWNGRYYAHTR